jgi:deoxyribodipyrimidine photo-lyase
MSKHTTSIFIFRRDLRLDDNLALLQALKHSDHVIPVFILDPKQVGKSDKNQSISVEFMAECLHSLNSELEKRGSQLHLLYGVPHRVLSQLIEKVSAAAVYVSTDYTPYNRERDSLIASVCKRASVEFNSIESELLYPVGTVCKSNGKIYMIYTPFSRAAFKIPVAKPIANKYKNYSKCKLLKTPWGVLNKLYKSHAMNANRGGRKMAVKRLIECTRAQGKYDKNRNFLNYQTSMLSPYLKFGCISPREAWHAIRKKLPREKTLLKQLIWREFYYNVAANDQTVFTVSMNRAFRKLKWNNSEEDFKKWASGRTGFPVVDAAMRQLLNTGYMHNRARLISASFLVKVLRINWTIGEKWFGKHLLDYDRIINTMNWQWVAGTGTDSQPWFRSFNPWIQSKKYDPDALYIKRWIPELKDANPKSIHNWYTEYEQFPNISYPKPMCDYAINVKKTIDMFRAASKKYQSSR